MTEHPFEPIFDGASRVLILGSFPSVKSREQAFYYGHPQNRFWRVIAAVCGEAVPETVDEKRAMLLRGHIAVWDVIKACNVRGSADNSIRDAEANDLREVLDNAAVRAVFVNGRTAEKYYNKLILPELGREAIFLPSTSPANAAWTFERLTTKWKRKLAPALGNAAAAHI